MIKFTLKQLLDERNLSITELSELANISRPALSKLSTGKTQGVQFDTLNKIVETLRNIDNKKRTSQHLQLISAQQILRYLFQYSDEEVQMTFSPVELFEMKTENVYDSSFVILQSNYRDSKYFDSANIKSTVKQGIGQNGLEFRIQWIPLSETRKLLAGSQNLSEYAETLPIYGKDYFRAYHLQKHDIHLDGQTIYKYLKPYVETRWQKFSSFSSFTYYISYNITNNFIEKNKNILKNYKENPYDFDKINCKFTWVPTNETTKKINSDFKIDLEFFTYKTIGNEIINAKSFIID